MAADKIQAIQEWPTPQKVKDVQSFLGFANFYRRFIKNFANIAKPLHILTKKDQPWHWGKAEENAFHTLKNAFLTAPVL